MSSQQLAAQVASIQGAWQSSSSGGGKLAQFKETPQGKIISLLWDALEGVLSVKTGIDWPNSDQVLGFAEAVAENWGALASSYVSDWSRSDAWARQRTADVLWLLLSKADWPCSSKIAMVSMGVKYLFPGKKAGSSCVAYWGGSLGKLMKGEPAPFYATYVNGAGKGPLMFCQPGAIASVTGGAPKTALAAAVAAFSGAVWEDYEASKGVALAPMLKGQALDDIALKSIAKGVVEGGKINVLAGGVLLANDQLGQVVGLIDSQAPQLRADNTITPAVSTWVVQEPAAQGLDLGAAWGELTPEAKIGSVALLVAMAKGL